MAMIEIHGQYTSDMIRRLVELLHCALKLVSVKLSGFALPRPTLSFGLTKSFFFSFLALADLPIVSGW